jgi:hypothetical protein
MVKGMIKTVPHADYEAQFRTYTISDKSGYGKGLLDGIKVNDQGVKYKGTFDSERFIHGRVHGYHVRFAAKLVASKLAEFQSTVPALSRKVEYDGQVEQGHLKLAQHISTDVEGLPKGLRAFVVAQIFRESGIDVSSSVHRIETGIETRVSRDVLKSRVSLKRLLLNLKAKIVHDDSQQHWKSDVSKNNVNSIGAARTSPLSARYVSSPIHSEHVDGMTFTLKADDKAAGRLSSQVVSNSLFDYDWTQRTSFDPRLVTQQSMDSKRYAGSHRVAKRRTEGFGTAPIWYQQSMENGPPCEAFSLEEKN